MSQDWEATFSSWGAPPSQTEQDKSDNAERAIRKAIKEDPVLKSRNVEAFAQGSYRNRTNVRADSDVDICIRCNESIFYDVPNGRAAADFGIRTPATYPYPQFKTEVESALRRYFGAGGVTRRNKAFDIHENTYRVSADAVPCFEYRRYLADGSYLSGTAFVPDAGQRVVNWPEQNYQNGVAKNDRTSRRFKAVVRILKRLRNEMEERGDRSAGAVPSFLIECLVWNVPDEGFGHVDMTADVRWALAHLFNETRTDAPCSEWGEINELKYLFRPSQPWTRDSTNAFLHKAWQYVGFD